MDNEENDRVCLRMYERIRIVMRRRVVDCVEDLQNARVWNLVDDRVYFRVHDRVWGRVWDYTANRARVVATLIIMEKINE